ncbi:MAG: matrixin family metalloprotease [Nitrosarchaeum sp.]|nr:matrixin family metalloprotease [Nitrosarchaeum sp.]
MPTELIKSSEKVKELSKIVPKNEQKILYYSIQAIPNLPDDQIPLNALHKALDAWKSLNPNLNFVESDDPDIEIRWQVYASKTHSGLATCNSTLFGILNHCVLDISVGNEDCSGNYVQNDENMVSNIIMHEIGHAIGLGHSADKTHLMYSDELPLADFDSQGFIVPKKFEELYVGQKSLLDQDNEIRSQLELLDKKISREKSQYDEYYKQYEYYDGKTLPPAEFEKAQRLLDKLNSEADKINSLIDQQNQLINQSNTILEILDCHPNFDVQN